MFHMITLKQMFANALLQIFFFANCKCKLDTRMNKNCSAEAGLGYLGASTAGAVKDAAGKAEPVP